MANYDGETVNSDGAVFIMNLNEECLLLFLNNPDRLESTIRELNKIIFTDTNNTIISNNEKINKRLKLINE